MAEQQTCLRPGQGCMAEQQTCLRPGQGCIGEQGRSPDQPEVAWPSSKLVCDQAKKEKMKKTVISLYRILYHIFLQ